MTIAALPCFEHPVAPKLLQYASQQHLIPIALAEFWWGAEPLTEVRHHGHFYPPCRGKCEIILPFMLQGVKLKALEQVGTAFKTRINQINEKYKNYLH